MTGLLIVNPRSGSDSSVAALCAAAGARGITTHVSKAGEDPASIARAAPDGPIGVAGGDGSLAPVAAVCVERRLPFVCIPTGTRNHFARDLGLDREDPVGALAAFTEGSELTVDVGWANERPFLNNVSLGAYAQLVHRREGHRRRRNAFARLRALGGLIGHRRPVAFAVDGEPVAARIVLVANNAYSLELLSLGERKRLDEHVLSLYVSAGIVRPEWRDRAGERFTVDAPAASLRAAIDGEPSTFAPPIEFRVQAAALRVLLPGSPESKNLVLVREGHLPG